MKRKNRILSDIYNLRVNKRWEVRKLSNYIIDKYGDIASKKDLVNYIATLPIPKDYRYTDHILSLIERLCDTSIPAEKFVKYISEYKSFSVEAIHQKMSKMGLKRNKFVYGYDRDAMLKRDNEVVNDYFNTDMRIKDIMKKYDFKTYKSVVDCINKRGLKVRTLEEAQNRKSTTSSYSFELIDSEFKAYYLGVLLTDGYLNSNRNNVSVQMCDEDIINFIAMNTNATVVEIKKKNPKCKLMYRTSIYNKEYRNQLKRLGVIDNKSLVMPAPELHQSEEQFIPYILRGAIDGDGWIRKDGKEFFICSSSIEFIDWCKEQFEKLGMTNLKITTINNEYNGAYLVRTARINNIEILKSLIYDKPFGMNRKYNLLQHERCSETKLATTH